MKQTFWRLFPAICVSLLLVFITTQVASAQQTLGSINGTVTDQTGAAIPGANVTVTDKDINVIRTAKSGHDGFFQIFNLPVGTYTVKADMSGFETLLQSGISVKESSASTVNAALKIGTEQQTVEVTANPMLNATDTTQGYTLDSRQIELTPLATASITELAVLSPGVNTELLAGIGSQAGVGNQPVWANGQRDTSNTFQVNGVDVTNLFNGKTSSESTSQRYNFNIGGSSTGSASAAGAATIGGANSTSTSTYGSNGNSLPSPPQEFLSELRVNTSMYDAQQGATAGAQIDVATKSGTNHIHGQVFGTYANNYLNADPYFFKQAGILSLQGLNSFPVAAENPDLHRWTSGFTVGGPIKKDKLFFFLGYEHQYASDEGSAISQFQVPTGLTSDRSATGLASALNSWYGYSKTATLSTIASQLLNATLPNGQFLIPSATPGIALSPGIDNATEISSSQFKADNAAGSLDYQATTNDRLSMKYYYQNAPTVSPFAYSSLEGFPGHAANTSQVFALDNAIQLGPKLNWEQRLGYARMGSYSYLEQTAAGGGAPFYGLPDTSSTGIMPGLAVAEFGYNSTSSQSLRVGPYSYFNNVGYIQNRLNPSTNLIYSAGKHTLLAGGGYSLTQLNIENKRNGMQELDETSFYKLYTGAATSGSHSGRINSISNGHDNANRYYTSNEGDAYVQDKWQLLSNLSITAGVRWDYHGGLTEKYGNIANFDPSLYSVSGASNGPEVLHPTTGTTGTFTVINPGFVIASNNPAATPGANESTLAGRQWGISPRVGFAWAPKSEHGKFVVRSGFGLYYDRGELFSYLSQPAGNGSGGPFGVTEAAPFTNFGTTPGSSSLAGGVADPGAPVGGVGGVLDALQAALDGITGPSSNNDGQQKCSSVENQVDYTQCGSTLNFGGYDRSNTLPYTINFSLNTQWQPTNDISVTIGYTGNRGRKAVIPIPFNEPNIATPGSPATVGGADPHPSGETQSYGMNVVDFNNPTGILSTYGDPTFNNIPGENWNTLDGGNTDLRTTYLGFSPNSALFRTIGNSSYDALETHIEKRMSHHISLGASYTYSHTLDDQSDIGLFFTGDDPDNLRDSHASADFDRTNVFTANFNVALPDFAKAHSFASYAINGWNMSGIAILQSGEPYSLYEFYGAVGSIRFGNYPTLLNPVLAVKDKNKALTGNKGDKRPGGNYQPAIDPSQIEIKYLTPGQDGIPVNNSGGPQDNYETDFVPGQRNIFRQSSQNQLNLSFRKDFKISERYSLEGMFNVFNVLNTTSLDVPQNETQIRQSYACDNANASVCADDDLNYGQIGTTTADQTTNNGRGTAGSNLDRLPSQTGTGSSTIIPVTTTNADFGSVTTTIGSNRLVTWGLRLTY